MDFMLSNAIHHIYVRDRSLIMTGRSWRIRGEGHNFLGYSCRGALIFRYSYRGVTFLGYIHDSRLVSMAIFQKDLRPGGGVTFFKGIAVGGVVYFYSIAIGGVTFFSVFPRLNRRPPRP